MERSPLAAPNLSFEKLDDLRQYLEDLLGRASDSLALYWSAEAGGFLHLRNVPKQEFSKTSTATCVAFLVRTGRWFEEGRPWAVAGPGLVQAIVNSDWDSAGLGPKNPFTKAFLLETICDLQGVDAKVTKDVDLTTVAARFDELESSLKSGNGIKVSTYPATSFMTQKALRVLARRAGEVPSEAIRGAAKFAWPQLREESIAFSIGEPDADVFELGYAVLIASQSAALHEMSPRQRDSITYAIDQFFAAQRPDGAWPRSQALFHYPNYGNAYCYDYEFLVQLLADQQLQPMLLQKIPKLEDAARALGRRQIPIGTAGQVGWTSGHLKREKPEPESWSTASAFHFCHALHRLIGEAIRQSLFAYVRAPYSAPSLKKPTGEISADFLDTPVDDSDQGQPRSLTKIINERLLAPLIDNIATVQQGQTFPRNVATSAILYGPPGTSKTELASLIADALGWPLLTLDPSHLTRNGLDALHAEANKIFTMLEAAEQLVVLLDEFDELVRDRDEQGSESASRFLTTAMLPKLAALSDRRRIVYLLATNHVERFDAAISREGRLDLILPVAPPTLESKLAHWPNFKDRLAELGIQVQGADKDDDVAEWLVDLTYSEFDRLQDQLKDERDQGQFRDRVQSAHKRCTLEQIIPGGSTKKQTWKDRMREQRIKIRPSESY